MKVLCFCASVVIIFCLAIVTCVRAEEDAEIGVPPFPQDLNLERSDHPAAILIRDLSTDSLVRLAADSAASMDLILSDSFNVNSDFSIWRFRIRKGVTFHAGRELTPEDVSFSLNRCAQMKALPALSARSFFDPKTEPSDTTAWTEIALKEPLLLSERTKFVSKLSACRITPADETKLFEADWGKGDNFIGSGPYQLISFKAGTSYTLVKNSHYFDLKPSFSTIKIRAIPDPSHGLTALRLGTIVALVSNDEKVNELARKDETLLIHKCPIGSVIARRSLRFNCNNGEMDLSNLKYVG